MSKRVFAEATTHLTVPSKSFCTEPRFTEKQLSEKTSTIFFGHAEAKAESAAIEKLLHANCHLQIAERWTFHDQDTVDQEQFSTLKADFLFSFGPLIVRKPLLDSIQIAAINFHPAPPRWPGRGSCSMAILHGDKEFGVTAHIMHPQIDAGPILKVIYFPILKNDDAVTLRKRAFSYIPNLVQLVLQDLRHNQWQPVPCDSHWERTAVKKKESLEILRINRDDTVDVIRRKLRASIGIHELNEAQRHA